MFKKKKNPTNQEQCISKLRKLASIWCNGIMRRFKFLDSLKSWRLIGTAIRNSCQKGAYRELEWCRLVLSRQHMKVSHFLQGPPVILLGCCLTGTATARQKSNVKVSVSKQLLKSLSSISCYFFHPLLLFPLKLNRGMSKFEPIIV